MMDETNLSNNYLQTILWQEAGENAGPEQPLVLRDWSLGLLEISQRDNQIMINSETLPELVKVLRGYQQRFKESTPDE